MCLASFPSVLSRPVISLCSISLLTLGHHLRQSLGSVPLLALLQLVPHLVCAQLFHPLVLRRCCLHPQARTVLSQKLLSKNRDPQTIFFSSSSVEVCSRLQWEFQAVEL